MEIIIRRNLSNKIGTHYGIYLDDFLIHYEFSRTASEKIVSKITSGMSLYEVLYEQISKEYIRQNSREVAQLQAQIISQRNHIDKLEKTVVKLEATIESKDLLCKGSSNSLDLNESEDERFKYKYSMSSTEANELKRLLKNMEALGFTKSSDLSKYITDNKLGEQYPNISGIVLMQDGGEEWDFEGGFPRKIYRIICEELNLQSNHTSAQAIGFKPFNDI